MHTSVCSSRRPSSCKSLEYGVAPGPPQYTPCFAKRVCHQGTTHHSAQSLGFDACFCVVVLCHGENIATLGTAKQHPGIASPTSIRMLELSK